MTLSGMSLNSKEKKTRKKSAREAVKEAKYLFNTGNITEDMFRIIVEWALAFEIFENMDNKLSKKEKILNDKIES